MGAEPWDYFVPYEPDIQAALDKLKDREFRAGRYRNSEEAPASIDEAREIGDADGTGSILDMDRIGDEPDFMVVARVPAARLRALYGTEQPTRAMIEAVPGAFDEIERGQGEYIIAYADGKPSEIFFTGYSFD